MLSSQFTDPRIFLFSQAAGQLREQFKKNMGETEKAYDQHNDNQKVIDENFIDKVGKANLDAIEELCNHYEKTSELNHQGTILNTQVLIKNVEELEKIALNNQLKVIQHLNQIQGIPNQSDKNNQIPYYQTSISKMTSRAAEQALVQLESKLIEWKKQTDDHFEINLTISKIDEKIQSIINEFKKKAIAPLTDFKKYFATVQQEIKQGKIIDQAMINNGLFILKLVEQVAKRYFETSRQLARFESLQNQNFLKKYENILAYFYSIRIQALESMHKDISLLQTQMTHERKIKLAIRNQKLKEQDLELSKILKLEIFQEENLLELLNNQ